MPTLGEHLAASFGRPEIAEQLRQLGPPLSVVRTAHQNLFLGMVLVAGAIAQRVQENFPSKAYSQYFKDHGVNPVFAKLLASLTISIGTREANARRQLAEVVRALRFLTPGKNRRRGAMLSQFNVLLGAEDDASMLSEIFRKAGLNGTEPSEFVSLLRVAAHGGPLERKRISELAAQVAPSLPSIRGRKVSPASAAHEGFLETADKLGGRFGYRYCDLERGYIDERTKATRIEFGAPVFNPRPAFGQFVARRKLTSNDGGEFQQLGRRLVA